MFVSKLQLLANEKSTAFAVPFSPTERERLLATAKPARAWGATAAGGRMKGVPQGRKQGVWEARLRAHLNDYVFEWEEERRSLSTRHYTAIDITN